MARRLELISAVLACTLGLMTVFSLASLFSLAYENGGLAAQGDHVQHLLGVVALLFIGVAVGAYLHSIFHLLSGLVLLGFCTGLLVVGALYLLFVPESLNLLAPGAFYAFTGWIPLLATPSLVLAAVATATAITPQTAGSAVPNDPTQQGMARPGFLARLFSR